MGSGVYILHEYIINVICRQKTARLLGSIALDGSVIFGFGGSGCSAAGRSQGG